MLAGDPNESGTHRVIFKDNKTQRPYYKGAETKTYVSASLSMIDATWFKTLDVPSSYY